MVNFQGGGWCTTADERLRRSKTRAGSTKGDPQDMNHHLGGWEGAQGLFSNNPSVNPDFYNWNKIFSRYCDGSSRTGNITDALVVEDALLYFRGSRILEAE